MREIVKDPYEKEEYKSNLVLREGDVLIVTFDTNKEPTKDIDFCNGILKYLCEAFPHNKIIGMFNGVELSVIREEN